MRARKPESVRECIGWCGKESGEGSEKRYTYREERRG